MSKEIKCCVVKDILPLYAENLCSEETAEIVREHIENCESCRKLSEEVEIEEKTPEKIPDEAKAMKKVNKKIKQSKKVIIAAVCVLLAVLIPVAVLWENMIWQNEKIPSFETIAQNSEVKVLAEMIAEGDFDSLIHRITPHGIYGDEQIETAILAEKTENLEKAYSALIGENKAVDTKCRTYYTYDVYEQRTNHKAVVSVVTIEYSDGKLDFAFIKENGRYVWSCTPCDESFDKDLLQDFSQSVYNSVYHDDCEENY